MKFLQTFGFDFPFNECTYLKKNHNSACNIFANVQSEVDLNLKMV